MLHHPCCTWQVGIGGYSHVYRATLYGRVVAAKQLLVGTVTDKVVRGLQHEAYVMSLTSHPNIAPFYGGRLGLAGCPCCAKQRAPVPAVRGLQAPAGKC